jgi:putative salt-induced outer membrane protein YdiY
MNLLSSCIRMQPMGKGKIKIILVGCMVWVLSCGYAQGKNFGAEAELAYLDATGNTDVIVFSAKNSMVYAFNQNLEGLWKAGARYGESGGEKNVERYFTELRINYLFARRLYTSVITKWLTDEFAGIHWRYYIGPALGYQFIKGPAHFLSLEAGVNYTIVDYTDDTKERSIEGRSFAEYKYLITQQTRFKSSIEFFYNFSDGKAFNINSELSLVNSLEEYLALKTSFEIEYDNKPVPSTLKKTDTVLSFAIIFTY